MSALKKLAGQTAIYGLPSIMGRFLNYLLVYVHVRQFDPDVYGIITELFSYIAFFIALLTYGMETAFFRFVLKHDKEKVYRNALGSIVVSSAIFLTGALFLAGPIAEYIGYGSHPEYIIWLAAILAFDAVAAIPLARLREETNAKKFALVNLTGIAVVIIINLFFIWYCMPMAKAGKTNFLIDALYSPNVGVGYVFLATLMGSSVKILMLYKEILMLRFKWEKELFREMLIYALPIMLTGLAGIVNETFSRGFFKYFLEDKIGYKATMYQLGIFGGVYKLSIAITLFVQAYKYAAEPFFFKQSKESGGKAIYVQMMNFFTFIVFGMFLVVTLFIDYFKYFINNPNYWEGLKIVPILLLANCFLGISYNLSVWYKLSGKTIYGVYVTALGAGVTILLNWLLIPTLGYVGAAWSTFACYTMLMVSSYFWGQKHYPIPYQIWKNVGFLVLALALFFVDQWLNLSVSPLGIVIKTLFLAIFAGVFLWVEKPKFLFKRA